MRHAMTIDVEDYFHVAAFNDVVSPADWAGIDSRVVANTHSFMNLMEEHGTRATFFMLGWVADRHPELVREIAARGHEIASHGYSHQLIYQQTPEVFKQETERSKKLLEDQAQAPVLGYRAASYSITEASLWALDIISECGFSYDSSIYPIRHDNYGLMGGPKTPYIVKLRNGAELQEFPITTAEVGGVALPVGGGGYFRLYPYWLTRMLLKKRVRQSNWPFLFYLHPWELDPDQPRFDSASRLSRFRHYTNLKKVHGRLAALLDTFEFASMADVLADLPTLPVHAYH